MELLGALSRGGRQHGHCVLVLGELGDDRGLPEIQHPRAERVERDRVLRDHRGGADPLGRDVPAAGDLPGAEPQAQQLLGGPGLLGVAQSAAVLILAELIKDSVDAPGAVVSELLGLDEDPHPHQAGFDRGQHAALAGAHHQATGLLAADRDRLADPALGDVGDECPLQRRVQAHVIADDQFAGIDPEHFLGAGIGGGLGGTDGCCSHA